MTAHWDRLFPGWRGFSPPTYLATLAGEAAGDWAELADDLQRRARRA
jgi:hypothetical protein